MLDVGSSVFASAVGGAVAIVSVAEVIPALLAPAVFLARSSWIFVSVASFKQFA